MSQDIAGLNHDQTLGPCLSHRPLTITCLDIAVSEATGKRDKGNVLGYSLENAEALHLCTNAIFS